MILIKERAMKEIFEAYGYTATVLIPKSPNGRWIWKTEFFDAFEDAEVKLFEMGYTRVYYGISDKFGSPEAVRLMKRFHKELIKRYSFLEERAILFGFSRGGLYAFNYALYYPEAVEKIYLDAPVLNLISWPWEKGGVNRERFAEEYNLNEDTIKTFKGSPLDNMAEFAENGIPLLIVAGDEDASVPLDRNARVLYDYYRSIGKPFEFIVKKGCGHHPHSLTDVTPIVDFVEGK